MKKIITLILLGILVLGIYIFKPKNSNELLEEYISVKIEGEVYKSGIYQLTKGSVLQDLIDLSGGLTNNANTTNIDLNKELVNNDIILIGTKDMTIDNKISNIEYIKENIDDTNKTDSNIESSVDSKININTATIDQLMILKGIGQAKALKIIEYRQNNKFNCIEDIMNIQGIGEKIFENIKENIVV